MEKSGRQGANRSHTAWYGEDVQRSRTVFLQAKTAVMNNSALPSMCTASGRPVEQALAPPAGSHYCTRFSIVICSTSTRRFGSRHLISSERFFWSHWTTGFSSPLPTAFRRLPSMPLLTR